MALPSSRRPVRIDGLHQDLTALTDRGEFSGVVRIDGSGTLFERAYGPASYTWGVLSNLTDGAWEPLARIDSRVQTPPV